MAKFADYMDKMAIFVVGLRIQASVADADTINIYDNCVGRGLPDAP